MAQQVCVVLSTTERELLAAIAGDRNRPRKHVERARILLASADRVSAQQVAHRIGVSRPTVWRWQQRFAESGVDGLLRDKTRKPGKAPIAAETTARVVALTCTEPRRYHEIGVENSPSKEFNVTKCPWCPHARIQLLCNWLPPQHLGP